MISRTKLTSIIKLMRPHQYTKNFFVFSPLFFFGGINNLSLVKEAFIGFLAFCAISSAVYILNDYLDIEDDRKHPKKKNRPLAAGTITVREALFIFITLLIFTIFLMYNQSLNAIITLAFYVCMNVAYSIWLKHIPIVDVVIISIGFVLRLLVGSFVTGVPLSKWIIIMTFLLALFLALAKRRDDVLHYLNTGKKMRKVIDGYNLKLIDGSMMIMASVVIVTYLLFTNSREVIERFDDNLYLTSLFVILGIMRYLQISFVEEDSGSPSKVLLKDKFTIINIFAWLSSYVYLIYF